MSTFNGKLTEIPNISIDRFDGDNFNSLVFFLSHCHLDHMRGLEDLQFQKNLIANNRFIYVSHVSAAILKNTYPAISKNLVELELHFPTIVTVDGKSVGVTAIPAGHCPGSVMFLFQADETVLYTGDYRINPDDLPKFNAFYDSMNNQKRIDAVYLDTTFFLKEYEKFPTRRESLDEICAIIKDWISRSDKHVIDLKTSAKYGYEYLFIEIYKKLKMPVHVNSDIYEFYKRVPDLDNAITLSKDGTKIHCACGSYYTDICRNTITYKIKSIKISAFRWKSEDLQTGISKEHYNQHYVCYSTHASYEEGAKLLQFLKPKRVEINVLHKDPAVNEKIQKNIEENLEVEEPEKKKPKLFKIQEIKCHDMTKNNLSDLERSILDSPPKKFGL